MRYRSSTFRPTVRPSGCPAVVRSSICLSNSHRSNLTLKCVSLNVYLRPKLTLHFSELNILVLIKHFKYFSRGIKHNFLFINIRKVPREVLNTEGESRGFQPSRGTLRMLMNDKIMFDHRRSTFGPTFLFHHYLFFSFSPVL